MDVYLDVNPWICWMLFCWIIWPRNSKFVPISPLNWWFSQAEWICFKWQTSCSTPSSIRVGYPIWNQSISTNVLFGQLHLPCFRMIINMFICDQKPQAIDIPLSKVAQEWLAPPLQGARLHSSRDFFRIRLPFNIQLKKNNQMINRKHILDHLSQTKSWSWTLSRLEKKKQSQAPWDQKYVSRLVPKKTLNCIVWCFVRCIQLLHVGCPRHNLRDASTNLVTWISHVFHMYYHVFCVYGTHTDMHGHIIFTMLTVYLFVNFQQLTMTFLGYFLHFQRSEQDFSEIVSVAVKPFCSELEWWTSKSLKVGHKPKDYSLVN